MEDIPDLSELAGEASLDDSILDEAPPPMTCTIWLKTDRNKKYVLQPGWQITPYHYMGQQVAGSPYMDAFPHDNIDRIRLTKLDELDEGIES